MAPLKRVNYFFGQLLSAADFQVEQDYLREKQRRYVRAVHGSGVVNGLKVKVANHGNDWEITVTPGLAIDPMGELLELCAVSLLPLISTSSAALVYLRYLERQTDRLPFPGASSDEDGQPSRIVEGCELVVVDAVPRTKTTGRGAGAIDAAGVALARLLRTRTGWRVDGKFKVARVR